MVSTKEMKKRLGINGVTEIKSGEALQIYADMNEAFRRRYQAHIDAIAAQQNFQNERNSSLFGGLF